MIQTHFTLYKIKQMQDMELAMHAPKRTPVVYLSGKITGVPDENKPKFRAASYLVRKELNAFALIPHELPDNHDKSWFSYMRVCVRYLSMCDQVVVLDCWKRSRGAVREVIIAKWLNIPVVCIEERKPVRVGAWTVIKLLLKLI